MLMMKYYEIKAAVSIKFDGGIVATI